MNRTIQISTPVLKFALNSAFDVTNIVLLMTVSLQQAANIDCPFKCQPQNYNNKNNNSMGSQ